MSIVVAISFSIVNAQLAAAAKVDLEKPPFNLKISRASNF